MLSSSQALTHDPRPEPRGHALVVDDELPNQRLLERLLKREGFRVTCVGDGFQAVDRFSSEQFDIVFMDVMMPGMDGYAAAREIKRVSADRFVPLIFLTALADDVSLVECVEAGGDDFLSKPLNFSILKARIRSMERMRDLNRRVATQHQALTVVRAREQREQELAERIFNRVVTARNEAPPQLDIRQLSAATFCGDVVLAAHRPDGTLFVLVGDFTGHGIAAAIGAVPVSEIFHSKVAVGADETALLAALDSQLYQLLPPDMFMAAALISLSPGGEELVFWNGGLPNAWLRHVNGLTPLSSTELPLGIVEAGNRQPALAQIALAPGDRLVVFTDGLPEAENPAGEMIGESRLRRWIETVPHGAALIPRLMHRYEGHTGGEPQRDDVTIVELTPEAT